MTQRIDLHHHVIPPEVIAAFQQLGFNGIGGVPLPRFDLMQTQEMMEGRGIGRAVVSLSDVGPTFARADDAVQISRLANNFMAELCRAHPQQFGAFATLPLPHLDESLRELARSFDELGLHGVMLLTNSEGHYLGDPLFDPLLEELNRRKAVVFVHPGTPPATPDSHLKLPSFLLEFAFETTRAGANLLLRGVPARYPHIKFILAHGGGTLPYLISRLMLGQTNLEVLTNLRAQPEQRQSQEKLLENAASREQSLRSGLAYFYYDTALSTVADTLKLAVQIAGVEHIVFGTDYPFVRDTALDVAERFFRQSDFDPATTQNIERNNALTLFPQWA